MTLICLFHSKPTWSLYHLFTYFSQAPFTDEKLLDSYSPFLTAAVNLTSLEDLNSDLFFPNYTISFSCINIPIGKTYLCKYTHLFSSEELAIFAKGNLKTISFMKRLFFNSNSHLIKAGSISTCRYNSIHFISILLTRPAFFPGNGHIFSPGGGTNHSSSERVARVCLVLRQKTYITPSSVSHTFRLLCYCSSSAYWATTAVTEIALLNRITL